MEATLERARASAGVLAKPLARALDELAIPILTAESVADYKRKKMIEVLDRRKPRTGRLVDRNYSGIDRYEAEQLRDWARQHRMEEFEARFYRMLFGPPVSHVAGWSVMQGLPVDAPAHVSSKADEITTKIPGARIETEVLMDRQRSYDPIVAVVLGAERYYFEVYDERGLEVQMF